MPVAQIQNEFDLTLWTTSIVVMNESAAFSSRCDPWTWWSTIESLKWTSIDCTVWPSLTNCFNIILFVIRKLDCNGFKKLYHKNWCCISIFEVNWTQRLPRLRNWTRTWISTRTRVPILLISNSHFSRRIYAVDTTSENFIVKLEEKWVNEELSWSSL